MLVFIPTDTFSAVNLRSTHLVWQWSAQFFDCIIWILMWPQLRIESTSAPLFTIVHIPFRFSHFTWTRSHTHIFYKLIEELPLHLSSLFLSTHHLWKKSKDNSNSISIDSVALYGFVIDPPLNHFIYYFSFVLPGLSSNLPLNRLHHNGCDE